MSDTNAATLLPPRGVDCFTNAVLDVPEALNLDGPAEEDTNHWIVVTKRTGHRHVSWSRANPIQVAAAHILWESFVAEGMEPYRVARADLKATGKGKKKKDAVEGESFKPVGQRLAAFDSDMEHVIFIQKQALVGG